MNQQEYELIGGAIHRTQTVNNLIKNQLKRDARQASLRLLVSDLIGTLAHNYPKTFDHDKFLKACGMEGLK